MTSTPNKLKAGLAAFLFATAMAGSAGAEASHGPSFYRGHFSTTDLGVGLGYDISGTVTMKVRTTNTGVRVKVVGLTPLEVYGSHLHNGTCADGGGGHYQNQDDGFGQKTPPNELWLSSPRSDALEANHRGVGHGRGEADWAARTTSTTQTNARSIVVHAPGGDRIACADLS